MERVCPALQPAGITEADSRWAEPGLIGPILDLVYSGPSAALQSVRGESSKSQIVYRERAAELLRENRRATDANRTGLIVVSSFGQPLDAFFVHAKALALCFAEMQSGMSPDIDSAPQGSTPMVVLPMCHDRYPDPALYTKKQQTVRLEQK